MPEMSTMPNQFAELTDYERHHLVNHFLDGELLDDVFWLLTLEENEQNAWYSLQMAHGRVREYASDISNALEVTRRLASTMDSANTITWQCCYALILASFNSLSNNFPPNYLSALVRTGIWTMSQALGYANQIPNVKRRSAAFRTLIDIADQSITADECLDTIAVLGDGDEYWIMVGILYPRLSSSRQYEIREQAIHRIKKNHDDTDGRTGALVQFAPLLLDSLDYYLLAEERLLSPQAYTELIVRLLPVLLSAQQEKVFPVIINYLERFITKMSEATLTMIIDIAPVCDLFAIDACVQRMGSGAIKAHALAHLAQHA